MGKEKFPIKLFKLLNNEKYNSVITWSVDGKKIIIKDKAKLTKLLHSEFKSKSKSCSHSESESEFTSESKSKPETKSESVIRQLNKYGFRKENSKEDIYFLKNFEKNKKEEIKQIKPKDIKKSLAEIKENKNDEEKIGEYIHLLGESKNNINPNLLKDILEFLLERHEQRKKISKDIQELKKFYGKIKSYEWK